METKSFVRKSFPAQCVRVTETNLAEVAVWCQGEIRQTNDENPRIYIYVRVLRPLKERQCMAFVGDWILHAGTGYKVYTNKAFRECFEEVPVPKNAAAFAKYMKNGLSSDSPVGEVAVAKQALQEGLEYDLNHQEACA